MNLVNCTPHDLVIEDNCGDVLVVKPSGQVARVSVTRVACGELPVGKIPVYRQEYGPVEGLPDPVEGGIYIVSALVASRVPTRDDVVAPGELVRDARGVVIGCKGLVIL